MFSVRLVTADSYQAKPLPQLDPTFSEFRGSEIKYVPVIRIFGITPNGEKTCLHVHGVFPYLFVPYTGEENPEILAYRLAASLDAAINVSLGSATSNTQHVYSIQRVSGTPFYGYHRKEHQFLKIYFYNPAMIKRAADLLQNGSVLNQSLQPHESHINYILQFMMDYNIYGMSLVNLRSVKHRRIAQTLSDLASSGQSLSSENNDIVYLPSEIERQSTCELEIDAVSSDILNRLDIENNLELNPGLAAIWNEERARRAQAGFQGGDSQLVNPKSPPRPTFNPTASDIYQEQRLARRLLIISQSDESTLSTTPSHSIAYAAEVREGESLLNASRVPNLSVQRVERICNVEQDDSLGNMSFIDSSMIPANPNATPDDSILGTDDMPLVDLLVQLAQENDKNVESVDTDSLLGSQVSMFSDEKNDNEDEDDVPDLNLTCLELDSLGSLETASKLVERNESGKNLINDKNVANTTNLSSFITPYEISSDSSKSLKDDDIANREKNDVTYSQMPQYDGAGDVSPTLLNSDNEDVQDNANNAKDYNHLPEYNSTCEVTSESRKSEKPEMKIISHKNSSITSINSDVTIDYDHSKSGEIFRNSYERDNNDILLESMSITNDTYLGQYGAVGYETFDRLLEISTDFVPDLADMQSSMEIGTLLSNDDTEKAEFIGENNDHEIRLDTVLNGDPCFTESAELDKSDLTELHDQYVSLLGNALLPDIQNKSIDQDLGDSFDETNFIAIEKNCEISSSIKNSRDSITDRDSSSSLENVAPNTQPPESRGISRNKFNDDGDSQNCKEFVKSANDASDYNCNVVATWAELQNLQIIDKTEINGSRMRSENGKYLIGSRSMKRRSIRCASSDKIASQVFRKNTEKIPLRVFNECPESSNKFLQSSAASKSSNKSLDNTTSLSSNCVKEKSFVETSRTNKVSRDENEERLSCGPLPNVPRLSLSSNEDSSEQDFPSLRTTASLDAFHRSIIGSANPLADAKNILPGDKYSICPLKSSDNLVGPILVDFDENSDKLVQNFDDISNVESETSHCTSYYSSQRSDNCLDYENHQHRHCYISQFNKIVQDQIFTNDQLWIIQKQTKEDEDSNFHSVSSLCGRQDCKLPVVLLKKVVHRKNKDIVVVANDEDNSMDEDLSHKTSNENVLIPDDPMSRIISTESTEQRRISRLRRTRKKSEVSLLTNNEMICKETEKINQSVSDNTTRSIDPITRDLLINEVQCPRQCLNVNETVRDPYNTGRHSVGENFAKQRRKNSRIPIENEKKDKNEMKKPRARTRYKESCDLPGIPGIINYKSPLKRYPKNIILSGKNINTHDGASDELSKSRKHLSSKLFPNWGAQQETQRYLSNGIVTTSPTNGNVFKNCNIEISPEKRKGRNLKAILPISSIPKNNTSPCDIKKNASSKFLNFSSTPEKIYEPIQLKNEILVSATQKKLPETVALGLLLQEAKSRSTRTALKLLLRKRQNEKFNYKKVETKPLIKKFQSKNEKSCEEKIIDTTITTKNPILPSVSVISEITKDKINDKVSLKIQENEKKMKNSTDSNSPSFEVVTDINSDSPEKNYDPIIDESLKNVTKICNSNEYNTTTLSTEFCNPVDNDTNDIFDTETAENSVIIETTIVEEFPNGNKQLTYDTDRYENAIKEANFFAGKDYSIDAVSNEIPSCLFEEDSNSVDKRISKIIVDDKIKNFNDSSDNIDHDTSSELSIDPRDLDVYDVESLTSNSPFSIIDESMDNTESQYEISDTDDCNFIESPKRKDSTNVVISEKIISENESSFEEDSPSFEALSPKPRVCSSVGNSLEKEFTVNSKIESADYPTINRKNEVARIDNATITMDENLSISVDNSKITNPDNLLIVIDNFSDKRDKNSSSTTLENSSKKNSLMTNENLPVKPNKSFFKMIEKIPITPTSKSFIKINDSVKTNQSEKEISVDNGIKELVSQVIMESSNELEISNAVENNAKTMSIIDAGIHIHVDTKNEIAADTKREKQILLKTEMNDSVLISSERTIKMPKIITKNKELSTSSERDKEFLIDTNRENHKSALAEKDNKLSTSTENKLKTLVSLGNEKNLSTESQKETEMQITVEKEKDILPSTQMKIESQKLVDKTEKLSHSHENHSELLMTFENKKNLSSSNKKELKIQTSVSKENDLSSSTLKEIQSPMIVENDEKLLESSEKKLEILTTSKKIRDCSMSTEKESKIEEFVENQSPIILEKSKEFAESCDNQSKLEITCEKTENVLSNSIKESKNLVEKEKESLPSSQITIEAQAIVENNDKVLENKEMRKELLTVVSMETEISTFIDKNEIHIAENENTLSITSKEDKDHERAIKKQENVTADSKNENQRRETISIDKKDPEKSDKLVKQSIIEIKTKQCSPIKLRRKIIKSKNEKEETEKKNDVNESKIIAEDNNIKNESVDINKNDVIISVLEDKNCESNQVEHANISKETNSLITRKNCSSETSKNLVECRPVSIKLVNIDLSKIHYFTSKNIEKPEIKEQPSSQEIPQNNVKETFNEKVILMSESRKNPDENTEDKTTIKKSISEINAHINEDIQKFSTTELQSSSNTNGRRIRKNISKDTRLPERRSVRICAEMTLKLSQRDGLSKILPIVETSGMVSTPDLSTSDEIVSEMSLAPNTEEKISQANESIEIPKKYSQSENVLVASTIEPSMDENLQKTIDDSTTLDCQVSQQESVEQERKINNSQEIVLSEQIITNVNATPSLIKLRKRGRPKKISQNNFQKVELLTKIIDENTEPIFDKPQRKNMQDNIQETFIDTKSSKSIPDDLPQKIVEKKSTGIDMQPIDLELKIDETNVDTQTCVASSKRVRLMNDQRKIRHTSRTRKSSLAKSARDKNIQEIKNVLCKENSANQENSMEKTNQDISSTMIFSLPTRCRNSNALKKSTITEEKNEFSTKNTLLPEKNTKEIIGIACSENNATNKKLCDTEIDPPHISIIYKRRGRSEKNLETTAHNESSKIKSSLEECVNVHLEVLPVRELSPQKIVEDNTEPKCSVPRRGRRRLRKISKVLTSPCKHNSETVKTICNIVDNFSQTSESLCEKITEESNEPKNRVSLRSLRRGRSGKSPETKLDSKECDLSQKEKMVTSIKSGISAIPKEREPSGKSAEKNMHCHALPSVQTSKVMQMEECLQEPQLLTRKMTEDSIESTISIVPKIKDHSDIYSEANSEKLTIKDVCSRVELRSRKPTFVLRKIIEENVESKISLMVNRKDCSNDKQTITVDRSLTEGMGKHSQECESVVENVIKKSIPTNNVRLEKRKRDFRKENKKSKKSFSQSRSSSKENISSSTIKYSEGSESVALQNVGDNIESRILDVSERREHSKKLPDTNFSEASASEQPNNRHLHIITETTTESMLQQDLAKTEKTFENNTCHVIDSLSNELPAINTELNKPLIPKKRIRFNKKSIRRCAEYYRNKDSSSSGKLHLKSAPKKRYRLSLVNRSPTLMTINNSETVFKENSNDSSRVPSTEPLDLESMNLLARFKILKNEKRNNVVKIQDNGVEETGGLTFSTNNNVSHNQSSLNDSTKTRELYKDQIQNILGKSELPGNKEYKLHVDEKLLVTKINLNDLQSLSSITGVRKLPNLPCCSTDQEKCLCCSNTQMIAYTQLQKPMIVLKRLSQNFLRSNGISYRSRDKIFVKTTKELNEKGKDNQEFQLPAYDGTADLSSSENEEDPDVTIAREEKRVCSYGSSKKTRVDKHDECIATSKKRKFDIDDNIATSPPNKRQALVTTTHKETPKKTSCRSPSKTSRLKSPGRIAGNYSPLKIIVTSPKVRKDTLEPSLSIRLDKQDENVNASSSSSSVTSVMTPKRKISRLYDNILRGRFDSAKSSCELGDKHATAAIVGSNEVGELDEIQSIGQTEHQTVNVICTTVRNESQKSFRIQDPTTNIRDGKDVRKKLLFSDKESKLVSSIINDDKLTGLTIIEPHEETSKLQMSRENNENLERIDDNKESIEISKNLNNQGTMMFDAVPGTSRGYHNEKLKNQRICDTRKERENDNDDDTNDDDDDDVCNVTFTQYIHSQINKNDLSLMDINEISTESTKKVTITPKFKPPSYQRVMETMESYGLPKYRNQEPFFSDPVDVPKQKELAQKILKVPGKGVDHLPAFLSSVEGVTGLARWRKMWLNEFHPSLTKLKEREVKLAFASNEKVIMTPLVKPPTQREVENWLKAREYLEKTRKEESEESKKKLRDSEYIKIHDQPVVVEKNAYLSNVLNSSDAESSPKGNLISDDTNRTIDLTLEKKLNNEELFEKIENLGSCKNDKEEKTMNSGESTDSKNNLSRTRDTNATVINPSLLDVLQNSRLFHDQKTSKHLGISYGQIEFLSEPMRSSVSKENLQNTKTLIRYQYLTTMCLEVHVTTRGDLLPDAQHDAIAAIFYSVQSDVPPTSRINPLEHGAIILAETEKSKNKMYYSYSYKIPWKISFANNEESLLNSLVNLITLIDPEILIGWELETLSWGYVFQRATRLGINLAKRISRIPATQCKWEFHAQDIETLAEVKLPGRIVLDIWRLMRHEAALLSYSFENVMHHVLNERIPCPSFKVLTDWWNLERSRPSRWRVIEHYSLRTLGIFRILDQLDIIGRTSELARLFGILFYEVFSRGSQFRVESVMLRLAKPLNYIAVSPSAQQRASMRAMEALPLIMEPESMFYTDPLIVLDFQSLYPSIIIAHNYCFSTCLGRIEHIGQPQPFEFGAYNLRVPKSTVLKLQGKINYAPCGVAYVKPEVRLGILPRMLTEILETRFMVKKAKRDHNQDDKTLQRALHSRQMGLKFLANVTYGYTAANFSGRMPCIEVGDSVVSKSKETLERAIKLVESTPKWGARVVYGDTDSLFILVPGKSKADAFVIGKEIADAVTASNPPPIKLQFEKVLYPAILQTKKRYCGYMYETPEQEIPTYLAKGIETVRRDGCPAVSKILEKTLKILFDTKDLSLVKKYVTRQLDKVLRGKVSIQDLIFAKEFRGLKGYRTKACVPALELTRRLMRRDPRAIPRNNERVRYVIVAGAPNQALIHCVRTPWELINDPGLRPNAIYYVTRVIIPPLNRCLNLMGVDVNDWYREMPHRQILDNPIGQPKDKQKLTIFQYFGTIVCVACGQPSNKGICIECLGCPADTLVVIHEKLRWLDRTNSHVTAICQSCVGQADTADCASLDCPVLYRRTQAQRELTQAVQLREVIKCGNNLEF